MNTQSTEIQNNVIEFTNIYFGSRFKFRQNQLDIICDIINSTLNNDKMTYICSAPTGSGKTLISIISACVLYQYYGIKSYILVSDLNLYAQYLDALKPVLKITGFIKGMDNYKCNINNQPISLSDCRMEKISIKSLVLGFKSLSCVDSCRYICHRKRACTSGVTLMPYQLYFTLVKEADDEFDERGVVFCDECHNIPSIVQNNYSCIIKYSDFDYAIELYKYCCENTELFLSSKLESINKFLSHYINLDDLRDKIKTTYGTLYRNTCTSNTDISELQQQLISIREFWSPYIVLYNNIKQSLNSKEDADIIKAGDYITNKFSDSGVLGFLLEMINTYGIEYVVKSSSINDIKDPIVELRFAREDALVNLALLSKTHRQVLLSATPGERDAFIKNIGADLDSENTVIWKELPSTFNFDKSPIVFVNRYKMTYHEKLKSLNSLKFVIDNILKKHNGERGLILTHSYDIQDEVFKRVSTEHINRLISYETSREKDSAISKYKSVENGVLVGPTLDEGIDLPGEYCRFIIILKVPYPNLADKLTKAKMKLFPGWYQSVTTNSMIQGIGRGNRFIDDYCTTYILDASFDSLLKSTKSQWPDWIINRIKVLQ